MATEGPLAALKGDAQAAKQIAKARKAAEDERAATQKQTVSRNKLDAACQVFLEASVKFNRNRRLPDRWAEWPAILTQFIVAVRNGKAEPILLGWCNRFLGSNAPKTEPCREAFSMGERRAAAVMLLAVGRNKKNAPQADEQILDVFHGADEYGCFDAAVATLQLLAEKVYIRQTVEMADAEEAAKKARAERGLTPNGPASEAETPAAEGITGAPADKDNRPAGDESGDLPILSKAGAAMYELLLELPAHRGMTAPEIVKELNQRDPKMLLDESAVRGRHADELKPYGLENARRKGYRIPPSRRPAK